MFRFLAFNFVMIMFAGSVGFAAEPLYKIDLNLTLDGSKEFHSQVIAKANSKFSITQEFKGITAFIDAVPKSVMEDGVEKLHTDFTVGTIDAQGNRTVRGTPRIETDDYYTATATTYNSVDQEVLSLSIFWRRVE